MKITEYRAQARKNENKNAAELRPGDFIYAAAGLGKDCNFADFVDGLKYATGGATLCKVVGVRDRVADVCEIWSGTMPCGELSEDGGEYHICPMAELFGHVKYGVTPCYYL